MSKDEIISLKNELFKEIHDVENTINQKLLKKFHDNEENIAEHFKKFNKMFIKGESLLNSLSTQIVNLDKINELENFRHKMDSIMISHEIRINNNIKDIKDMKFRYDKEINENLTVPGFVGPSCKFKSISGYISSNIDEISKIKIENEVFKKENKDLKKKVEEIIKTCLKLIDNTNTKFLQHVDVKTRNIEQFLNMKLGEFNDKIVDFKSLLMTQKNAKDIEEILMNELKNNNYTKNEIEDKIKDILNNFETNIKEVKMKCSNDNILVKISIEKIEKEIIEINKSIKEIKTKIKEITQNQIQLMKKNNLLIKEMKYNSSEKNLNNTNNNLKISPPRKKINEEEKQTKFGNSVIKEKSRTIDLLEELKIKDNFQHQKTKKKINKEFREQKLDNTNMNNSKNKIIENTPKNYSRNKLLNNSSTQNEKEKFRTNLSNINSVENNISISDNDFNFYHPINSSYNKNDINEKDENYGTFTPYRNHINLLKKINNNKNKNGNISNLKSQNNKSKNKNNISDLISFGFSRNQKAIIIPLDNDKNIGENNVVQVINVDLIKEKIDYLNSKNNNSKFNSKKNISKKGRNSMHKLAAIGFEDKTSKFLPSMGEISQTQTSLIDKFNKTITPFVKNVFQQSYQTNKTYKNLNTEVPVKIKAAFGRTGYTYYDKKEEGINYLMNKGIENKARKHKSHSTEVNFKLCPTAKIKVFGNM